MWQGRGWRARPSRVSGSKYVTRVRLARAALFQVLLPPNGRESPMRVEIFFEHAPKL